MKIFYNCIDDWQYKGDDYHNGWSSIEVLGVNEVYDNPKATYSKD